MMAQQTETIREYYPIPVHLYMFCKFITLILIRDVDVLNKIIVKSSKQDVRRAFLQSLVTNFWERRLITEKQRKKPPLRVACLFWLRGRDLNLATFRL